MDTGILTAESIYPVVAADSSAQMQPLEGRCVVPNELANASTLVPVSAADKLISSFKPGGLGL